MRTVKILAQESAHTYGHYALPFGPAACDTGSHGLNIQLVMWCNQILYDHHVVKGARKFQNGKRKCLGDRSFVCQTLSTKQQRCALLHWLPGCWEQPPGGRGCLCTFSGATKWVHRVIFTRHQ